MKLRDLFEFVGAYRRRLMVLALSSTLGALVMLCVPWLAGQMLGRIIGEQANVASLMVLLLGALVILAALKFFTNYLSMTTSLRLLADLRVRIYSHVQNLPITFHHNRRQGDILALATLEVARLGRFLTGTLVSLPSRFLTAIGAVVLMFRIDQHLALLIPAVVPIFYLVLKTVGRRLRWLAVSAQQAEADVLATIDRNLGMMSAIKSFARETTEAAHYLRQVERSTKISIEAGWVNALLEPLVGLIAGSAAVLLLYTAGQNVEAGSMTGVELFSFLFYAALLTRPIGSLAHLYGEVQSTRGTLERLHSVLKESPEPGYDQREPHPAVCGNLSFQSVDFGYPGRGDIIRNVNLEIKAGEKIALIGENGAGKSTLINLLLRFCEPDRGRILVDGHDIASFPVQDLRRQIGVVPQRAALFNGTVRANIAFGLEGASDSQVTAAARLAQAHDFISRLPEGYDTQIGDHGVRLSGGQRQRVSLARALVKSPPILVFDEATSMFDLEGERAFIDACSQALEGRTVLLVTHRPASLAIADRIVCVENGTLREIAAAADDVVAAAIR